MIPRLCVAASTAPSRSRLDSCRFLAHSPASLARQPRPSNTLRLHLLVTEVIATARILAIAAAAGNADMLLRAHARRCRIQLAIGFLDCPHRLFHLRFSRCPPSVRPDYTAVERCEAARLRADLGLGVRDMAARILVDPSTVSRWDHQLSADPIALAQDRVIPPKPPIEAWVQDLVRSMAARGFRGYGTIRNHLHRVGVILARSSVARFLAKPQGSRLAFLASDEAPPPAADTTLIPMTALRLPAHLDAGFVEVVTLASAPITDGLGDTIGALRQRAFVDPNLDPKASIFADVIAEERTLALLLREFLLLHTRFARLHADRRPYFRPQERLQVLEYQRRFRLPCHLVCRIFLIDRTTLGSWRAEVDGRRQGAARLPCDCPDHSSSSQAATQMLREAGATESGAASTARTILRRLKALAARLATPKPAHAGGAGDDADTATPETLLRKRSATKIRADYRNHVWFIDLTQTLCLGGGRAFIAVVQDAYSRLALRAVVLGDKEPTGPDLVEVFNDAVKTFGAPRHLITDQGPQFTDATFKATVLSHGSRQRYGAVGKHGSIAVIERLILTIKLALGLLLTPKLHLEELQTKLDRTVQWYNALRPHTTLGCATPIERYRGLTPAAASATPAPRRPRDATTSADPPQIKIRHLDPGRVDLPYLTRAA